MFYSAQYFFANLHFKTFVFSESDYSKWYDLGIFIF